MYIDTKQVQEAHNLIKAAREELDQIQMKYIQARSIDKKLERALLQLERVVAAYRKK